MRWTGVQEFNAGFDRYEQRVKQAVFQVGQYWAAVFEEFAKTNAIWTDRTGQARMTLHGFVEELTNETIRVYISHGAEHGVFLETMAQGKWGIVWVTIERHLEEIRLMLQRIFG